MFFAYRVAVHHLNASHEVTVTAALPQSGRTSCSSEQLPVLELGCGLFGCFQQDLLVRLEDYFVRSEYINEDIATMGQCAKVTEDKKIPKTMQAKCNIKSWTRYVLICI